LDDAIGFPVDGGDPIHVRAHRRVTGKGLAANIKISFPPIVLYGVVLLLLVANTLNIAADVAAMREVSELVTGFDRHLMTVLVVVGTQLLQVFVPYHRYEFFS
jgi:Mn2+/Fe2+ NRAMP family transporter